ncbi:LysR family transcriptional regulator [Aliiglaciecola sp. CAU 1673]|uniref:LysR family transcriptional regulator n=1 Tax=Aliiglaciecola sp. CAU 1673 TaxID=3032595 RepID=UPI0023DBDC0B|nr:LysR family transcriptional regulator [Aliiglaciecola sp. CAU 1673]MDF2180231.1 LysR family transcriptional regulator [Aliiglaciecola sp. CAU 1673]
MPKLNYHHLYYFWQVACTGNLTQAAADLHTSQSALSAQIRQLEHNMDVQLFHRQGRKLVLTEVGQQTLLMANDIFAKGEELEAMLKGSSPAATPLRIGAIANMSRNFIEAFVSPLLHDPSASFTLTSKGITELLQELANHQLDVVLSNINVAPDSQQLWQVQMLARQPLSIVGPVSKAPQSSFPEGYENMRWVLPGKRTEMRAAFDAFCSRWQFEPNVQAEADDMAMLRLLARDTGALAVLPKVVVKDEISTKQLMEYMVLPKAFEHFYAITIKRTFVSDRLQALLHQSIL